MLGKDQQLLVSPVDLPVIGPGGVETAAADRREGRRPTRGLLAEVLEGLRQLRGRVAEVMGEGRSLDRVDSVELPAGVRQLVPGQLDQRFEQRLRVTSEVAGPGAPGHHVDVAAAVQPRIGLLSLLRDGVDDGREVQLGRQRPAQSSGGLNERRRGRGVVGCSCRRRSSA